MDLLYFYQTCYEFVGFEQTYQTCITFLWICNRFATDVKIQHMRGSRRLVSDVGSEGGSQRVSEWRGERENSEKTSMLK